MSTIQPPCINAPAQMRFILLLIGRTKKLSKSKNGIKLDKSVDPNTKVLAFLEAEERRLRGNELRYSEKIRSLSLQLEAERGNGKKLADISRHFLETKHKLEMLNTKFEASEAKNDAFQKDLDAARRERNEVQELLKASESKALKLENEAAITSPEMERLNRENAHIRIELESSLKKILSLEEEVNQCVAAIKVYDREKGKIGIRLIKEREQSKIKIAELQKEKQIVEENLKVSNKHAEFLKSSLATKEETFREKVEQLLNTTKSQIESEVAKATIDVQQIYKSQLDKSENSLSKSLQAYHNLEQEFRRIIGEERSKIKSVEQQIGEKNRTLHVMSMREKEQTETISDLIKLIKDLKLKLSNSAVAQDELERKYKVIF